MSWRISDRSNSRFRRNGFPPSRHGGALLGGSGDVVHIITAVVRPLILPLTSSQTPADAFPASSFDTANYASTAGTISTAVREVSLNDAAFTTTTNQNLDAGDTVTARVVVTDSAANVRIFFLGTVTVPDGALALVTFDTTAITFDSNSRTFDEAA